MLSIAIVFFFIVLSITLLILSVVYVFSGPRKYFEKTSSYECGFQAFTKQYQSFDVQFFYIGMLFLIFDLEIILIFPWIVNFFNFTGATNIFVVFLLILLLSAFVCEQMLNLFDGYPRKIENHLTVTMHRFILSKFFTTSTWGLAYRDIKIAKKWRYHVV